MSSARFLYCPDYIPINTWIVVRGDFKATFHKIGESSRDAYVRLPREGKDCCHYRLLLAAVYGLVNSNAKFQTQTDVLLLGLGPSLITVSTQLFYLKSNSKLV